MAAVATALSASVENASGVQVMEDATEGVVDTATTAAANASGIVTL